MRKQKLVQLLSTVPRILQLETRSGVFHSICSAIDSPRSLTAWLLYESKEFAQLVSLEVDPLNYNSASAFADDLLCSKFLSKFPDFDDFDLDPEAKAKSDFRLWELTCEKTNEKFKRLDLDPSKWDPLMHSILERAKRKIRSILGKLDLNSISSEFCWGPGATTAVSGSRTSAYVKFKANLDVTSNALVAGQCCVNSTPSWVNCQLQTDEFPSIPASLTKEAFRVVRGNEIVFVPKNAKTHRVIAKEPHVNSYLQKGVGSYIGKRLALAGIDLTDQTINQTLACRGSLDGSLATIDLSGASDTISTELVRYLLPHSWFVFLDQLRSKQGYLRDEDEWIYYHKFSSMGNAFTFELESLLFFAISWSVLRELRVEQPVCNVFGDDIIVNSEAYELVAKTLSFCGFTVNMTKSFSSGPYRESCGKDYFLGHSVRPIFLKKAISNVESIYKLANSLRRYSHSRNFNYGCDYRFRDCWQYLFDRVSPYFHKFLICDGFGDGGFVVNFDEAAPSLSRPKFGHEGYKFKAIIRVPVKERMRDGHAAYVAGLSVIGSEEPLLGLHSLRKSTHPKETRILTVGWKDLGPWL